MKLICTKIKSHTCLEIFQSTNDTNRREDIASCSRAFRKPKNAEEERKSIEMVPQSQKKKKCFLKNFFWSGPMVDKQKSPIRALRIHNWQVLSATLGNCHCQYYRCVTELLAD